ncbi:MAG: glycosyltransferase, partial [Oscillospiraceae bacterium]|nr:glycosyltransferase [Oscillospiraceae bacterium]
AFECRQLPYEMGHHYDPVTLETSWASAAALAVKRDVFEKIGGFDEHLFMYCEDVDLSWRIRAGGWPLYYVPQAAVTHHVLQRGEETSLREYSYTWLNELLLRYKFGTFRQIWHGNCMYLKELRHPRHFDGVRKALLRRYISHFYKLWPFLFWRLWHKGGARRVPARFENGFEAERGRAVWEPAPQSPFISLVVRTCSRPATLQKTLECLRHQTYKNFEVIVTEDGPDTARNMIEQQFADLPVRYYASGERRGRGKNGNYGLSVAKGEYCNFLDDDDYLYADHLELMAQTAARHPEADLILGCAMAMKAETIQKDPYRFEVKEVFPMRFDRVDLFTMCQTCQIPIQSAMFKKTLFEKYGGLDERLEGNEDWAMWMNFLSHGKRIDPEHVDIHRATSIFVLPAGEKDAEERLEKYKIYDEAFFNDPKMEFCVSLAQMRKFYKDVLGDVAHLQRMGKLEEFLEKHLKG